MTIEEAIAQAREKADKNSGCWKHCASIKYCDECEQEHKQLAEWLEELKAYRASVFSGDMTQSMLKEERNKAIDDYRTEICKAFVQEERNENYRFYAAEIKQLIADLGEKLKAGK